MSGSGVIRGKCFCSSVQFELVPPTEFASHCHCEDCRSSHSAAFVTWTSVPTAQFRLLSGRDRIRRYESHPGVFWGFCAQCGTSMFYDADDTPGRVYVTVASLVDPLDRKPDSHMSFEESVPWLDADGQLPRFLGKTDEKINRTVVAGTLHHVELYVSDLKRSTEFWSWFLGLFSYVRVSSWEQGESWKLGDTYIVFVQTEAKHLDVPYHRKKTGLNHLAFHATSREQIDQVTAELRVRGVTVLYPDRHPYAGYEKRAAVFFEDPDRIKVELVAPRERPGGLNHA